MKLGSTLRKVAGAVVLLIIGTAVGAALSRSPAGADIAEGGSPLYGIAVEESIKGLRSKKDEEGSAQGAVCPTCGKVHASPDSVHVGAPADAGDGAGETPGGPGTPCPVCGKIHPLLHGVPASGAAAFSAGGIDKDYFYCPKCKVYHRRQAQPDHGENKLNAAIR